MAKIYDLSVSLRPDHLENSELQLNRVTHAEAARIFAKRFQIRVSDLPGGSFFSTERIELRSHLVVWFISSLTYFEIRQRICNELPDHFSSC